jgi:hypothetical protein
MARIYRDLTDHELERLIRGLPRREPGADLRRRVLLVWPAQTRRRSHLLRPALVLAALPLLILADALILNFQNASLRSTAADSIGALAARTPSGQSEFLAWVGDTGASSPLLRIALLRAEREPLPDTYSALLRDLCEGANGG